MKRVGELFTFFLLVGCAVLVANGCKSGASPTFTPAFPQQAEQVVSFEMTSGAFAPGEPVPVRYTCDGDDVSPPLQWSDPPDGTQSFVLIADDPDAPGRTWVHWVLYNLPAQARSLPEAVAPEADTAGGDRHGENSWNRLGYGGPCPPSGSHRYFFKLYALDTALDLEAGADKARVLEAMEGHILAQAELMGTYSRQ